MTDRAYPILKFLEANLANRKSKAAVRKFPHLAEIWAENLSIWDIMLLKPIRVEDVKRPCALQAEFADKSLMELACLMACAYF